MRIRTIKPEFFLHFDLWEAERESQLPLRARKPGVYGADTRNPRWRLRPQ